MIRVLVTLITLLVAACAPAEKRAVPAPEAPAPSADAPVESVPRVVDKVQWIQFGMVLSVAPVQVSGADGAAEMGMDMRILTDSGETVQVVQPVSQAGRLNEGDRVRILRIGGFSRVTFWPYGALTPQ